MSEFAARLRSRLAGSAEVDQQAGQRLERHYELLTAWNERLNLTAIRSFDEAIDRHYAESLFLASQLPAGIRTVVDIGSGAGFPGAPLAMVRPDLAVSLVEAHARKSVFLRESTRDLTNVRVHNMRIEAMPEVFDCATMRAVAWRDVRRVLPRLARSLAFLLSRTHAGEAAAGLSGFRFEELRPLPWNEDRVVLIGHAVEQDRPVLRV